MSKRAWTIAAVIVVAAIASAGSTSMLGAPEPQERDLAGLEGDVAKGAYVARLAGCIGCHTDVAGGGAVLAGGVPITTRFGSFVAPNITPDPADGIGAWTVDDFATALTAGISPGGAHYYPSFPYPFYRRMTDQDIVDLWAAVRSVPAVEGGPPGQGLNFPFNIRAALAVWKALNLRADPATESPPDPSPATDDGAIERGRYIVDGPAHCGSCHTPRGPLGGRDLTRKLQGGESADGERAPAITSAALRDAGWLRDDLAFALQSGVKPDGDVFGGTMSEVVRDSSQYWTPDDLDAVAAYLLQTEGEE